MWRLYLKLDVNSAKPMPRKLFKRWSPDPAALKANRRLRFLGKLLDDPNLFHMTRYSVSTACFFGLLIGFFPVPIGHIPAIAVLALWLRFNLPIGFALVMISNPLTFAFIYYSAYVLGSWILQMPVANITFQANWQWFMHFLGEAWLPLVVGCFSFGIGFGGLSYLAVQWLWRWQVHKRWQTRHHKKHNMLGPLEDNQKL